MVATCFFRDGLGVVLSIFAGVHTFLVQRGIPCICLHEDWLVSFGMQCLFGIALLQYQHQHIARAMAGVVICSVVHCSL